MIDGFAFLEISWWVVLGGFKLIFFILVDMADEGLEDSWYMVIVEPSIIMNYGFSFFKS